jgi:hypothetical protein
MQEADDVVDGVAVDGETRVGALHQEGDHLLQRSVDVDGGDLPPRHHQLLRLAQVQAQRALQPQVLVWLEQSAVPALRDEQSDLFR